MELDYKQIGRRIAKRLKKLNLKQAEVSERADISNTYMSNIERAKSIPSTEVIMRLAFALETTPDEFLVGTARHEDGGWKNFAELLRTYRNSCASWMNPSWSWSANSSNGSPRRKSHKTPVRVTVPPVTLNLL